MLNTTCSRQQPPTDILLSLLLVRARQNSSTRLPPLITSRRIACGRLLGGNLSMIAAVMGTPYALDAEGIILFIEDVNEPIYRIDRLLTHLRLAGKLGQVAGVLVGDVAGVDKIALECLLKQTFEPLCIPVLSVAQRPCIPPDAAMGARCGWMRGTRWCWSRMW